MMASSIPLPPGTAPIKPEYLISLEPPRPTVDDDTAENSTSHYHRDSHTHLAEGGAGTGGKGRKYLTKEQRKAQRGANKGRKFGKTRDELNLCWKVANGSLCEFGAECRFTHDIPQYLAAKSADIRIHETTQITDAAPFVTDIPPEGQGLFEYPSILPGIKCPIFEETGECRFGFKCRFLGGHLSKDVAGNLSILIDEEKKAQAAVSSHEANFISADALKMLRTKKYPTPIASTYLQGLQEPDGDPKSKRQGEDAIVMTEPEQDEMNVINTGLENWEAQELILKRTGNVSIEEQADSPDVALRFSEKKRLHWTGKTYLAPLTTVGNLPFRRLCVDFGVDITCGEMGLANSFLSGSKEEWSLVRRHPSERIFGVQVAGNRPGNLVPTAEVLAKEIGSDIDFVDVNCGCPIDLVFKTGSGSALLDAPGKLGKILIGMNKALGDIPVTAKLRTGVKDGRNTAHKLMPRLSTEFSAGCITLHGRTRQQRYTRLADWGYIKQCVEAVRAAEKDKDLPPVPIFGGGDCFSSEDYWSHVENVGVDGIMIGRGALIKPWIFTEIKERREWDISARERLDIVRRYAEYGLNHFGSDTAGVNTTRRYLCEALSFQYRYVPIGLLERLPARINERAAAFRGRSELETLLASPNSNDWVKISEFFLGPTPESWVFIPKHKNHNGIRSTLLRRKLETPAHHQTMQLSLEEQAEQENVQLLVAMMGGNVGDTEVARKVLRKHNGDIEKAADAMLRGDRGDDMWLTLPSQGSSAPSPSQAPPAPSTRLIDLTSEDDDISRALQMSMETSQNEVRFGPSERAPDPAWQMVPSNMSVDSNVMQEDEHLKEAIQASLKDFPAEEPDVLPFEDTIREGGRPVALRAEAPDLAYAALVFHTLFHIPQVREQVAILPLPSIEPDAPKDSFTRAISNIVEYFSNLDLAQLSAIVDKDLLTSLQASPINKAVDRVGESSADFMRSIAHLISKHVDDHREENESVSRLFFFRHDTVEYRINMARRRKKSFPDDGFVVLVDVGVDNIPNDLIGALSANLSRYTDSSSTHDVIIEPSDVVAFHLSHKRQSTSRSSLDTFVYPKTLYLDRFLLSNIDTANQKRRLEQDMNAEIVDLMTQKENLTKFNNRDTLGDLRSTLYYYEHVASAADPERERQIQETTEKLRSILTSIKDQLDSMDRRIEELRAEVATIYDCSELQHYRYDLRAVLIHTGLPGRKQIYSYVQDVEGTWWKTVDFTVTEVTEEVVLTDPNGLHMNAGPYLLLYSRYLCPERIKMPMPWPIKFTESVEQSNDTFLQMIPPELAAKAKIPPSMSASESTTHS